MASSLASGNIVRTRAKGRIGNRVGAMIPEFLVPYNSNGAAPGAVGQFIFIAPRACRVVAIREVHNTAGAGASVVSLRKHAAGQSAAANAAVSGTDIQDVVTGGIAADAAVRVPQSPTVVTAASANVLAAGAKLSLVTPATWVGHLDIFLVWD